MSAIAIGAAGQDNLNLPVTFLDSAGADIQGYCVIGPFETRNNDNISNFDFIIDAVPNISEQYLAKSYVAQHSEMVLPARLCRLSKTECFVDFKYVFNRQYDAVTGKINVAYALADIEVDSDRKAWLLMGSDTGLKVWCNGEVVHEFLGRRGLNAFDDACMIQLKAGRNRLMFKVWSSGQPWGMAARLELSALAAAQTALFLQDNEEASILRQSFYSDAAKMRIAPVGVPKGFPLRLIIKNGDGVELLRDTVASAEEYEIPSNLSVGFYTLEIGFQEIWIRESFAVGSVEEHYELAKAAGALCMDSGDAGTTLNGLLRRCEVLFRPDNRPNRVSHSWERKALFTFKSIQDVANHIKQGGQWPAENGMSIIGFRSSIDDSSQYYRIFVPGKHRHGGSPIPLAVMLPTAVSASRPFLESIFISEQNEAERMACIAEKLGMAILWSGYRNKPVGAYCEFTHLDEVLRNVQKYYNIDKHRISLFGACGVGAFASLAAKHWPERFCAIGLLAPVFEVGGEVLQVRSYYRFPDFRENRKELSIMEMLDQVILPPIYIVNDGAEPGHGELAVSEAFMSLAARTQNAVTLNVIPKTRSRHYGAWKNILVWLSEQKRENISDVVSPLEDPRKKTVEAALAESFLVVQGTLGDDLDMGMVNRLTQDFMNAWKQTQFGDCRIKNDKEVTESDLQNGNLILIGNPKVNKVWGELVEKIPYQFIGNSIVAGDRVYSNSPGIQAAIASPYKPGNRIVIIGGPDLSKLAFGTMDLSTHGWFSYAIWEGYPVARLKNAKRDR